MAEYVEQLDRNRLTERINASLDEESSALDPVLALASLEREPW